MGNPGDRLLPNTKGVRRAHASFTLFGLLLAVSLCCLVMAFVVAMRESIDPRLNLDRECFSADGSKLAVFYRDGHVDVFDTATGAVLSTFRPEGAGDKWQRFALPTFSADGRRVVVVGFDEKRQESIIQAWDGADDRVLQRYAVKGIVRSVAISPDGSQLAIIPPRAVGVSFLDVASGNVTTHTPLNIGVWRDTPRICYSPDGRQLALAGRQLGVAAVALMDVCSGTANLLPTLPPARNSGIAFSPDGQQLGVRADSDAGPPKLFVFDGDGLGRVRSFGIAFRNNFDVYFLSDSQCVVERSSVLSAVWPGDLNVFDLKTLAPTDKWRVPFDYRAIASAAPAAVTMHNRQFYFYDIATGEPTGVKIAFGAGKWPPRIILVLFLAWVFCLVAHRRLARKVADNPTMPN